MLHEKGKPMKPVYGSSQHTLNQIAYFINVSLLILMITFTNYVVADFFHKMDFFEKQTSKIGGIFD